MLSWCSLLNRSLDVVVQSEVISLLKDGLYFVSKLFVLDTTVASVEFIDASDASKSEI